MPSYRATISGNWCIVPIWCFNPLHQRPSVLPEAIDLNDDCTFRALVDTGADVTFISPRVTERLVLKLFDQRYLSSISEVTDGDRYLMDLLIPPLLDPGVTDAQSAVSDESWFELTVTESKNPLIENVDVWLGMDVLKKCEFSMANGAFVLSY